MEVLVTCLLSAWVVWGAFGSTAHLHRMNDQTGRCIYSFTVPSANEARCADQGEAMTAIQALQQESKAQRLELVSTRAKLGLLEDLINQLRGSQAGRGASFSGVGLLQTEVESLMREQAQRDAQVSRLESTISNLLQDKSLLEEDKRQLQEEKEKLGQRLETSVQDVAQLRANQCPQFGEAPTTDSFQGSREGNAGGHSCR